MNKMAQYQYVVPCSKLLIHSSVPQYLTRSLQLFLNCSRNFHKWSVIIYVVNAIVMKVSVMGCDTPCVLTIILFHKVQNFLQHCCHYEN